MPLSNAPKPADVAFRRALLLHQHSRLDEARVLYEQVTQLEPRHLQAVVFLGVLAVESGQAERAVELTARALQLDPRCVAAHIVRGRALHKLGQREAAVTSYDRAIELVPDNPEMYLKRGDVVAELGRPEAALASYDKVVALKPDCVEGWCNRGNMLKDLRRFQEALESYDRALALREDHLLHNNRATVLDELQQPDAALASYERAISLKPDYVEAHGNRATLLGALGRTEAALAGFDAAIAIDPECARAYFNRGLVRLLSGDFENGWEDYEWRWKINDPAFQKGRVFPQPRWSGHEPLRGKTILLHREQGIGDLLQCCRYVKLLAERGAGVILEAHGPALSLLARNFAGLAHVIEQGTPSPPFDYWCPLMSVPRALGTRLQNIPASARYLESDPGRVEHWRRKLGEQTGPRVGLVWSGRTTHPNDQRRSIALVDLIGHLPAGCQYFSLQKEVREHDRRALHENPRVQHFADQLQDLSDTAAVCECMDVVISVDTSVAHLSGALGRTTWMLLPFGPDWRWLLDRNDSPWYPTARLYRQSVRGDWHAVLARVSADLARLFGTR
jgi:tetratricopeptide (TPR) repeat protein